MGNETDYYEALLRTVEPTWKAFGLWVPPKNLRVHKKEGEKPTIEVLVEEDTLGLAQLTTHQNELTSATREILGTDAELIITKTPRTKRERPALAPEPSSPSQARQRKYSSKTEYLDDSVEWNNLTVLDNNRLAHAALTFLGGVVEEQTLAKQTPLEFATQILIYGPVGAGKTYHLHATANAIRNGKGLNNVLFLTAEQIKDLYSEVSTRQNGRTSAKASLMERLQKHDVLMIDDLALRPTAAGTMGFLARIMDFRKANRKPVIISTTPTYLASIEKPRTDGLNPEQQGDFLKFASRVLGMENKYQIRHLTIDEAIEFARQQFAKYNQEITPEVLSLVARTSLRDTDGFVKTREYAGRLKTISQASRYLRSPIDIPFVLQVSNGIEQNPNSKNVGYDDVVKTVADYFHLEVAALKQPGKSSNGVAKARGIAAYLLRHNTDNPTFQQIGSVLGIDHSSAVSAVKRVRGSLEELTEDISTIKAQLGLPSDNHKY